MSGLLQIIIDEVRFGGPMRFDRYMQLALYHPEHGYYASRMPGEPDMWRTSPTISERFGELMLGALARSWELLGEPETYTVVELGAGRGDLARQAMGAAEGAFADALRWHVVELQPTIREQQQRTLSGLPVTWSESVPSAATGCLIANEVLDNFPARVFDASEPALQEVYVDVRDGLLTETLQPTEAEASADLDDAQRFERQEYDGFALDSSQAIERGHLIVIDYGDVEPSVFHPFGTLVCYRGEHLDIDPLADPGEKDITCHVNFTRLSAALQRSGWELGPITTQRDLLVGLGVERMADALRSQREDITALAELGRLSLLYRKGALGDLKVLLGSKSCPALTV